MPAPADLNQHRVAASWALERWAGFPVDTDPRPWVFVGSVVRPDGGFRSAGAKHSFMKRDITTTVSIPDSVLGLLIQHRHQVSGSTQSPPLVIDRASLSQADFLTDRGQVRFPAWGLEGDDIIGTIWVLDPEVMVQQWTPPEVDEPAPTVGRGIHRSFTSRLEDDGQTLHFQFTGGAPEHVQYPDAVVIESKQAVAVIPIVVDIGPPGPRRFVGCGREVVVHLGEKLGAHVLVNLDASPVFVVRP